MKPMFQPKTVQLEFLCQELKWHPDYKIINHPSNLKYLKYKRYIICENICYRAICMWTDKKGHENIRIKGKLAIYVKCDILCKHEWAMT